MHLIDTNIAIYLRDVEQTISSRFRELASLPAMSILTYVELEGGIDSDPSTAAQRREHTAAMLAVMKVLPLDAAVVREYGAIVATLGFARRLVLDRLIAATAIVNDLTLISINAADFRDIPGLSFEIWAAPGQ